MSTCDVCGGSGGSHIRSKDYKDLYLTILKIGQSKVSTGLNYRDLVRELKQHGYDTDNGCVILAVKHWFFHSFYHLADGGNPCNKLEELDLHTTCNFILKAESSLLLLEHESTKRATRLSVRAIWWAVIAIIVSIFANDIHDWLRPKQNTETSTKGRINDNVRTIFK